MLEFNTTSNTRGHSKKLTKKSSKLNIRKNVFTNRITDIWNSLPEEVVSAKSVRHFEIMLDNHWKNQECKYDFSVNINIRKSGCDVKSNTIEEILEADIVAV